MSEIDKLKKLYEAKIKEAKKKEDIISEIVEKTGVTPRFVSICDLYGRIASVEFGDSFRDKKLSDPAIIKHLMETLPATPKYIWKDSCMSFRCGNTGEGHNGRKEFTGTIQEINPYTIKIGNCTEPHAVIEWFHKLESGEIVEIEVKTIQNFFGRTSARYNESRNLPRYTNSHFLPDVFYREWEYLRWWSSGDYPADYTLYTTDKTKAVIVLA